MKQSRGPRHGGVPTHRQCPSPPWPVMGTDEASYVRLMKVTISSISSTVVSNHSFPGASSRQRPLTRKIWWIADSMARTREVGHVIKICGRSIEAAWRHCVYTLFSTSPDARPILIGWGPGPLMSRGKVYA